MTQPIPDGLPQPRRMWAMVAYTFALICAALNVSLINVALPDIAGSMSVAAADAVWIVIAFQLAVSISLFPLAAIGERIGYRIPYVCGIFLFTFASLLCAFAPNLTILVVARALQGFGASGIMAVNIALLRFILPAKSLGRGIGYNTFLVSASSAAGPSIASAILSVASWKWLFLVNIPFGIVAFAVALVAMPATPRSMRAFDFGGAALTAITLGIFILAVDGVGRGDHALVLTAEFFVAGVLFALLILHQRRRIAPILPIDLLKMPIIGLSSLTAIFTYIVQALCLVSLPFHFHDVQGFSLAAVGLAMTPWPLAITIASPIAGRLSERLRAGWLATTGLALIIVGLITLTFLPESASLLAVGWRMALCGFGFGLFQVSNTRTIIENAPAQRSAGASAIQAGSRLFGQSIGAALVAACFGLFHVQGSQTALLLAMLFAGVACAVSALRLRT